MILTEKLRRPSALAVAALLLVATLVPALSSRQRVSAALLGSREIKISTSAVSATATYDVQFNVATTGTVQGIVVQFCNNTPIIGDTNCDAISGFSTTGATLAGESGITGFSLSTADATRAVVTNAAGGSITSGSTVSFDIVGVTNPDTANHTFYARIYTYATAAAATGSSVALPGAFVDAGGIALSTAAQITVTGKVQEKLTFCVYTDAIVTNNCTVTGTDVTLGDINGVLDAATVYTDASTKYNVATNASGNVIVRIKGDTLQTGGFTIDPIGDTAAASVASTEQFGLCTYEDPNSLVAGVGTLTPAAPYADAECTMIDETTDGGADASAGAAEFAFDTETTNSAESINSTYGMPIATKAAGDFSTGRVVFMANISNVTEAGIYSTVLTFIATGTY